ncbi:MAG: beta-hydroxyacyl-ACP dehydratase [Phycisphaerae bacterium]|nr:beta-hydroxyacyl-ACP dehydratase [Phycisphaerae bacterium]
MASPLLFDLDRFDLDSVVHDVSMIEAANPQRGAMRQLDGIVHVTTTEGIGVKNVADDEFWVDGHIPGRPLMPGVLMIETAAQMAGYIMKQREPDLGFIGFLGCDSVKFRGQVVPGDRFYILARAIKISRRRFICETQGVVEGNLVFEGVVSGMPL